jgi:hypothetical protein
MSAMLGHGQGTLHGRAQADLDRGIDPVGRGGSGGEVTTREEVGATLSQLGVHGGHGDALGKHGVDERRICEVGLSKRVSRDGDHPLGVGVGGGDRAEGREGGVLAGFGLGLPFFPSIQPDTTKVDLWQHFLARLERNCW